MRATLVAALVALPGAAGAFHDFPGMQADIQLLQAIDQMALTLGQGCQQMGVVEACQGYDMLMGAANRMAYASDACLQGNPAGCEDYRQGLVFMSQSYVSMTNAAGMAVGGGMGTPGFDPANPLGATHQDRMDAIAGFGATASQGFADRGAASDAAHAQFLDMIRQ